MSIYQRIFGRELPCSLSELLPCCGQDNSDPLYLEALAHLARGQGGLAFAKLSAALSVAPASSDCHIAAAIAAEMLASHEQAAGHVDAAADLLSANGEAPRSMLLCAAGFAYERAGQWQRAAARYQAALVCQPDELFAHNRLAAIHLAHAHPAEAAFHLRAVLATHPADQASRACVAHLMQIEGRYAEAAWEYEQSLCLAPDTWELPPELAADLHTGQSTGQTIALLESLVASQPHFPDLRMRLANLYSHEGDDSSALREYQSALQLHPEYLDCHIALARHELRMGRAEWATEHLRQAIAINNQHVEIYAGLALSRYRCGQTAPAAEILDSVGRIALNSAVLMAQLGMLENDADPQACSAAGELRGDWIEELILRDQQLLGRHPTWSDLRIARGMYLRLLGRREQAFQTLRSVALDDACEADAWLQLAFALNDLARPADACNALASAMELPGRWAELHYRLGLLFCGQLEFDLTMQKVEAIHDRPQDVQRRIWTAIESMQLASGPRSISRRLRTPAVVNL